MESARYEVTWSLIFGVGRIISQPARRINLQIQYELECCSSARTSTVVGMNLHERLQPSLILSWHSGRTARSPTGGHITGASCAHSFQRLISRILYCDFPSIWEGFLKCLDHTALALYSSQLALENCLPCILELCWSWWQRRHRRSDGCIMLDTSLTEHSYPISRLYFGPV